MVACRFYLSGATKKEIGSQLGISRFKVARLLELARRRGLVQDCIDLTEVSVVEEASSNLEDDRERLAMAAAPIVADLIETDEVAAIGWGRTRSATVDHLPAFPAGTVMQIAGGALGPSGDSPADVPRRLAERFDVESFLLHTPLFVSDPAPGRRSMRPSCRP